MYHQHQNVVRENYITLATHFTADQLYRAHRLQVNELLGVPVMQSIIDGLDFKQAVLNSSLVRDITNRLDMQFAKYFSLLTETKKYISKSSQPDWITFRDYRSMMECARITPGYLNYEEQFGTHVNMTNACLISTKQSSRFLYYAEKNLTSVLHMNALDSAVRWQYIIGTNGPHVEYPAHALSVHKRKHWGPFLAAALPQKRRVVILIDAGTLLSDLHLIKAKNVAKILLDGAVPGDRYMVMVSNGTDNAKACKNQNFLGVTSEQIAVMTTFIEAFERGNQKAYSHSSAIQMACRLFVEEETFNREDGRNEFYHNILFYISRGVMSQLGEAVSVLSSLAETILEANIRVKINTLALDDGDKTPLLWSYEFLKSIAEMNFTKYQQSLSEKLKTSLRKRQYQESSEKLRIHSPNEKLSWSYPFSEYQATLVSLSSSLHKDNKLTAVVGVDLNLDIIADVIKYNDLVVMAPLMTRLRIFLCDLQGRVIIASHMRKMSLWPLHIGTLEAWSEKDLWLSEHFSAKEITEGSFEIVKKEVMEEIKLKYTWIRLKNAPFVVVMAVKVSEMEAKISMLLKNSRQEYVLDNLVYHRLDIQRDSSLLYCSHFGYLSTMKLGGVYLSPSCFTVSSLQRPPSPQWIANYWVYLGDPLGLIRNAGIRLSVREHVSALSGIIPYWRDKAAGDSHEFILRRYIATSRGVMITYPATVIRDNYEPDLELWYVRANEFPGKIVVTGPFLEDNVGQVVTISTAVFEGQAGSMHNSKNQIFAVIAMDVTVGFFAKLLRSAINICKESRRCILFDDLGNVISRGIETSVSSKKTRSYGRSVSWNAVERFHISYLEPQLATYLITKTNFVQKDNVYSGLLAQLNIPCDDTSSAPGMKLGSIHVEVIPVPQTNLFLALINESCDPQHPIQAFCPCSVSDRRCLLCTRFDDAECECPCQCPLNCNTHCTASSSNVSLYGKTSFAPNMECSGVVECPVMATIAPFSTRPLQKTVLSECISIKCENYKMVDDCLGVLGCQWCIFDSDGQTLLLNPFCVSTDRCFGGTKGRRIRGFLESELIGQWSVGAPVGPVAAGIMSVFLIMVMAVYCYRSQVSRLVEANSLTDSYGAPLCGRNFEDDDFQLDHDGSGSVKEQAVALVQLTSFERMSNPLAAVRPQYRVSPRTESSDQGYSTMTDRMQDESECATNINILRETRRTMLTTLDTNEDGCSIIVTTEADIHQAPRSLLMSS
ncbi:VWFA and cache domain-containing protein 1 [Dirofilaria immitis]|nr:VWFA and cache domain-containing protein 1 [Dirofilaria immitis]